MSSSADSTKLTDDVKAYFAGWRVEEGKYDVDSGMPEFPIIEVVRHVTMRTVQVASVLAVPVGAVAALRARAVPALSSVMSTMRIGAGLGLVLGPVSVMGKLSSEDFNDDLIEDRAMRIAHNEGQVRVDKACLATTAAVGLPLYIVSGSVLGAVGAGFALGSLGLVIEMAGGPSVESLALAPYALAYNVIILPARAFVWAPEHREPVAIDEAAAGGGDAESADSVAAEVATDEERA